MSRKIRITNWIWFYYSPFCAVCQGKFSAKIFSALSERFLFPWYYIIDKPKRAWPVQAFRFNYNPPVPKRKDVVYACCTHCFRRHRQRRRPRDRAYLRRHRLQGCPDHHRLRQRPSGLLSRSFLLQEVFCHVQLYPRTARPVQRCACPSRPEVVRHLRLAVSPFRGRKMFPRLLKKIAASLNIFPAAGISIQKHKRRHAYAACKTFPSSSLSGRDQPCPLFRKAGTLNPLSPDNFPESLNNCPQAGI